ncbi:hypothetical protein PYW07_009316 [Mythimna separata]|uniref:Exonuclease domain-containing protein n=1 Tax=Mythimna separata TaxID=271217 RepID=A0AAD7YC04_MYTSE|nr:hypothetical protein PYW07_009316 [Mythimna separata]
MTRVATYVFLDLETTGLPKFELNKTRITELSMVVVSRRHILATRPGCAPRVQDKLSMCFNPQKFVHPESTAVTGLDNDLLEHKTPFNMNVFNIINSFLQCAEKPVCLVAQNGLGFDFPILKNHIEKLGVSLPDDILCADSLHAFYDIFKSREGLDSNNEAGSSVVDHKTNGVKAGESSSNQKQDTNISEKNVKELKSGEQICNSKFLEELLTEEVLRDFAENDDLTIQKILKPENDDLTSQKKFQQENEQTPVKKQQAPIMRPKIKARRRLFYNKDGTTWCKAPSASFKLKDVYERLVQRPAIEAHRAENDCVMAMETSVAVAKEFVDWVDLADNHCKFSEVNAMTLGVPLGD